MVPSAFQLALFLYDWDMVLATPLPLPLNKALHHVLAYWIGQGLLGFEYFLSSSWLRELRS